MKDAVGFLGLGNMGAPMARRIMEAGYSLYVHDPRDDVREAWASEGAQICAGARDMADKVPIIFLSLPTPDVVEQVVSGDSGLVGGAAIHTVIDLSTTGPDVSKRIASALKSQGTSLVDAPVSGGVVGAKAGTLAIMASGAPEAIARTRPLLELLGRVFVLGPEPGMGQLAKLLNNLLSAGAMALSAESAAMGVRAGLDAASLIDVFNAGSGRSSATLDKYPKAVLPGTFNLGFSTGLMVKDLTLCLAQADAMGLEMPTSRAVFAEWQRAVEQVGPDSDFSQMMQLAEQDMGVEVRASRQAA